MAAEKVEVTAGRIGVERLLPAARVAGYEGSGRRIRTGLDATQSRGGGALVDLEQPG